MANPHRSLLSTLTSVEETHAPRYRCTTAIRFSSYSHCLQTTKLKMTPNKKTLEKQKENGWLQLVQTFCSLEQDFQFEICLVTLLVKDSSEKVPSLGRGVSKRMEKRADVNYMIGAFATDRSFCCLTFEIQADMRKTSKSKPGINTISAQIVQNSV